jgi:hypothetical protein
VVLGIKTKPGAPYIHPCSPAMASVVTDKVGKKNHTLWEWLVIYELASTVSQWQHSPKGSFIVPSATASRNTTPSSALSLASWDLD